MRGEVGEWGKGCEEGGRREAEQQSREEVCGADTQEGEGVCGAAYTVIHGGQWGGWREVGARGEGCEEGGRREAEQQSREEVCGADTQGEEGVRSTAYTVAHGGQWGE